MRVVAPAGLDARLDGLHGEPGFTAAALDVEALSEGTRIIGPFELQAARVTHTDSSYGFRVSPAGAGPDTPGLVYSGDCGVAEDLDALARPGDTLLCEVSFGPGRSSPAPSTSTARPSATSPGGSEPGACSSRTSRWASIAPRPSTASAPASTAAPSSSSTPASRP